MLSHKGLDKVLVTYKSTVSSSRTRGRLTYFGCLRSSSARLGKLSLSTSHTYVPWICTEPLSCWFKYFPKINISSRSPGGSYLSRLLENWDADKLVLPSRCVLVVDGTVVILIGRQLHCGRLYAGESTTLSLGLTAQGFPRVAPSQPTVCLATTVLWLSIIKVPERFVVTLFS